LRSGPAPVALAQGATSSTATATALRPKLKNRLSLLSN
jgi:hypothetical protein